MIIDSIFRMLKFNNKQNLWNFWNETNIAYFGNSYQITMSQHRKIIYIQWNLTDCFGESINFPINWRCVPPPKQWNYVPAQKAIGNLLSPRFISVHVTCPSHGHQLLWWKDIRVDDDTIRNGQDWVEVLWQIVSEFVSYYHFGSCARMTVWTEG